MPFLVSCSSEKTKHNFLQKIEKLYFDARNENNPNVIGRVLARCINKVIHGAVGLSYVQIYSKPFTKRFSLNLKIFSI